MAQALVIVRCNVYERSVHDVFFSMYTVNMYTYKIDVNMYDVMSVSGAHRSSHASFGFPAPVQECMHGVRVRCKNR